MNELTGVLGAVIGLAVAGVSALIWVVRSVLPEAHRRGVEIMEKQLTHCQAETRTMTEMFERSLKEVTLAMHQACKYQRMGP